MKAGGRLLGVGVGPGDPELLTLRAARALEEADVVAHFSKRGNGSRARAVVAGRLRPAIEELPLLYPVTTEMPRHSPTYRALLRGFYDEAARRVAARLDEGLTVAVLSEGDPFFYGSYMHLHVRLARRYHTEVVPGVTAMSACWSLAGRPIAQGDDVTVVLPGTLPEGDLVRHLGSAEAAVIMKVGRNLGRVRRALAAAGRLAGALYVEYAAMPQASVVPLAEKPDDRAPYFSVVLVPGWDRAP